MYDITLKQGETEFPYLWRLGQAKDAGLLEKSWDEIAEIMNKTFREDDMAYTEASYRKAYQDAKKFYTAGVFREADNEENELKELRRDIMKERQKLMDERREARADVRREARYDYDMSVLAEKLTHIGTQRFPYTPAAPQPNNPYKTMIVVLSDLHIGATYDSASGTYDSRIAAERMRDYCSRVIALAKEKDVAKVYIVLLGDFQSGSIHKTIAVTNRENVIEQTKLACELIAEFVYHVSCEVPAIINVCCVPGNHSRLEKKEDALTDERLDLLIPWFVKHTLSHCTNVEVRDNEPDSTYSRFAVDGKTYVAVHGDYDGMSDGQIQKLCMYLHEIPYCVLMGHKHFNATSEVAGVKVVQGGSLCGTGDNFTREHRLLGRPEQMVLICEHGEITEYHPIEW